MEEYVGQTILGQESLLIEELPCLVHDLGVAEQAVRAGRQSA